LRRSADLREQPQRFSVIGDGARKSEQTCVSLEDDDLDPGEAEKVRGHQADWPRAHHDDFGGARAAALPLQFPRHGSRPSFEKRRSRLFHIDP
jgi:hypothetical protein